VFPIGTAMVKNSDSDAKDDEKRKSNDLDKDGNPILVNSNYDLEIQRVSLSTIKTQAITAAKGEFEAATRYASPGRKNRLTILKKHCEELFTVDADGNETLNFKDKQILVKLKELLQVIFPKEFNDSDMAMIGEHFEVYQNREQAASDMAFKMEDLYQLVMKVKATNFSVCKMPIKTLMLTMFALLTRVNSCTTNLTNTQQIVDKESKCTSRMACYAQAPIFESRVKSWKDETVKDDVDSINWNQFDKCKAWKIEENLKIYLFCFCGIFILCLFVRNFRTTVNFCNDFWSWLITLLNKFRVKTNNLFLNTKNYVDTFQQQNEDQQKLNKQIDIVKNDQSNKKAPNQNNQKRNNRNRDMKIETVKTKKHDTKSKNKDIMNQAAKRSESSGKVKRSKFLGYQNNSQANSSGNTGRVQVNNNTHDPRSENKYNFITNIKFPISTNDQGDTKEQHPDQRYNKIEIKNQVIGNTSDTVYSFTRPEKVQAKKIHKNAKKKKMKKTDWYPTYDGINMVEYTKK